VLAWVFFVDDIEQFHSKAVGLGVTVVSPPKKQPWGGSQAIYADPDGLHMSIVEFKSDTPCKVNMEYCILFTKDLPKAAKLYEDLYGFYEPTHYDDNWLELKLNNGGRSHSTLSVHGGEFQAGGTEGGVGQVDLGFFVKNLDEFHANALKHNLTVNETPAKAAWGGFKARYTDSFGVTHSVVQFDISAKPGEGVPKPVASLSKHIEIPVLDMARAKKFFGDVFQWTFVDHVPTYSLFKCPKEPKDLGDAMGGGLDLVTSEDKLLKYHVLCFITDNVEASLEKAVAAGGKVLVPKFEIPHVGWQAFFSDTEGNQHSFYKSIRQ